MIDTSNWKEFRVGDYFHGIRGTSRKMQSLDEGKTKIEINLMDYFKIGDVRGKRITGSMKELPDGDIPIISAAGVNNGICRFADVEPHFSNCLTVNSLYGITFFHNYDFSILDRSVYALEPIKPIPKMAMSYIASLISAYFENKSHDFQNRIKREDVEKIKLIVPANEFDAPDWDYMENYMTKVMEETEKKLDTLKKAENVKPHVIDTSNWGDFRIKDFFEIKKGKRLTKENMTEGDTIFIGSTSSNNGQTASIGQEPIFEGNCITVAYNGSIGESFYQSKPFWASDDINVLYLKNRELNEPIALYLCTILRKFGKRYEYTSKWSLERMKADVIKLPVTPTGEPDWQYMESYMAKVMKRCDEIIERFKKLKGES